jgi:hypothetical protein
MMKEIGKEGGVGMKSIYRSRYSPMREVGLWCLLSSL